MADLEIQAQCMSPPKEDKKSQTNDFITEICSTSISSLIFAILFGLFTSDAKYYGGPECVDLYKWGRILYYLFVFGVIFFGVVAPLLFFTMVCCANEAFIKLSSISISSIRVGYGLSSLVIFIALCVAYSSNEPCGDLRTLSLVYIILVAAGLGLWFLFAFCGCCCTLCVGGSVIGILGMAAMQNGNISKGGYSEVEK